MKNLFWGFVLVLFGGVLLLDNLGYADFGEIMGDYWPLLLILWGISVLRKSRSASPAQPAADAPPGTGEAAEIVQVSDILGDVSVRSTSLEFKGGSVSTFLGDARIDLTRARTAAGTHELRIHSVFGSSTIILPKQAPYAISARTTFGSLTLQGEHKSGFSTRVRTESPSFASSESRLTIIITHLFGASRVEEASPPPLPGL